MIRTRRWDSLVIAALILAALGVVFRSSMLLSFTAIPLTFVAYGAVVREPPLSVRFERSLSPSQPEPGDDVTVELTVTNTGEKLIPDLRLIDGVPPKLGIRSGSARIGMVLQPGETKSFEYTVTASQGKHGFQPITTVSYTASGTVARRDEHDIATVLACQSPIDSELPGTQTSKLVGRVLTESGGSGTAFHSVREYRSSDTLNRINWRRYAQTGELSTVKYHQEKAANVHLLLDTRPVAFRQASVEQPSAVELTTYAAEQHFSALSTADHRVGIGFYPADVLAVEPASGPEHAIRAKSALEDHKALQPVESTATDRRQTSLADPDSASDWFGPDTVRPEFTVWEKTESDALRTLLSSLPDYGQCIVFTPLLDDEPGSLVTTLSAYGYEVSVVSPDVTARESPGARVSAQYRRIRIRSLREQGITVIDWTPEKPLSSALARGL